MYMVGDTVPCKKGDEWGVVMAMEADGELKHESVPYSITGTKQDPAYLVETEEGKSYLEWQSDINVSYEVIMKRLYELVKKDTD